MNAVQFVHRGHREKPVSSFGAHSQRPVETTQSPDVSTIIMYHYFTLQINSLSTEVYIGYIV